MSLQHVQPLNEQEAIEELQGIQVRLMARIERIEDCESKRDEFAGTDFQQNLLTLEMTLIDRPNWPVVSQAEFEDHLATCPDYTRTGYIGAVRYFYRHNDKHFATVIEEHNGDETIYLKPTP